MALTLDLRWRAAGHWYRLCSQCGAGLTLVEGPAAPALLRLLAGRPVPHEGAVHLDGYPLCHGAAVARHGPRRRPVAAVLVDDMLPPWRTPLGHVAGAARTHGVSRNGARARAAQALGWAGKPAPPRRPLALLSGPDRGRVALARALALVPGLLLLERPCAPLPTAEKAAFYATLRELAAAWEMVVLLIPDSDHAELPILAPIPLPVDHSAGQERSAAVVQ